MSFKPQIQGIQLKTDLDLDFYLPRLVELFVMDRRSSGCAAGTLIFYSQKLQHFLDYCDSQMVHSIKEIDANFIRSYMINLEEKGHNRGGLHAHFRSLRTFLKWYESEVEGWPNPINRVKAPRLNQEVLPPVSNSVALSLLSVCDKSTVFGCRDAAIILTLLDTGLRATELCNLNRYDLDQLGTVFVHLGKGRKDRIVFIGKKTKSAIKRYLNMRKDNNPALFLSKQGDRLTYDGLRQIISRKSTDAGVNEPSLHSFRRAFAINMLRAGVDIHTLSRLMGHSDISILSRYLKIEDSDIRAAHKKAGPVDGMG